MALKVIPIVRTSSWARKVYLHGNACKQHSRHHHHHHHRHHLSRTDSAELHPSFLPIRAAATVIDVATCKKLTSAAWSAGASILMRDCELRVCEMPGCGCWRCRRGDAGSRARPYSYSRAGMAERRRAQRRARLVGVPQAALWLVAYVCLLTRTVVLAQTTDCGAGSGTVAATQLSLAARHSAAVRCRWTLQPASQRLLSLSSFFLLHSSISAAAN